MALWKDPSVKEPSTGPADPAAPPVEPVVRGIERSVPSSHGPVGIDPPRRPADRGPAKESLIAADVTIEGKIEGAGHVRIAGRFKGDVNVQGDLPTLTPGGARNDFASAPRGSMARPKRSRWPTLPRPCGPSGPPA